MPQTCQASWSYQFETEFTQSRRSSTHKVRYRQLQTPRLQRFWTHFQIPFRGLRSMRMLIDSSELTATKCAIGMDASPAILRPGTQCPLGLGVERGPLHRGKDHGTAAGKPVTANPGQEMSTFNHLREPCSESLPLTGKRIELLWTKCLNRGTDRLEGN
jgi:hypothetical protein